MTENRFHLSEGRGKVGIRESQTWRKLSKPALHRGAWGEEGGRWNITFSTRKGTCFEHTVHSFFKEESCAIITTIQFRNIFIKLKRSSV